MDGTGILVVKASITALPGAWIALGTCDNVRFPSINRDDVARVLALEALSDVPEIKARVAHRAVTSPRVVRTLFAVVVLAECLTALLLVAGSGLLMLSATGFVSQECVLLVALTGAAAFTGVSASFLIGGKWFYCWYGEFGQQTHLLATLWGLATLIVLLI